MTFLGMFKEEMGIDLGTVNTLIYVKGKGIVLREPTVMAINTISKKILAVGSEAENMIGRTPENIVAFRPLRNGVIADFDMTHQLLKIFIEKVTGKNAIISSKIVMDYTLGITDVEKSVITETANRAGESKVELVEEPLAAGIGAGLPVNEPIGSMVVDIGGGITEVAAISLGGIVAGNSLRVAGYELDKAIIKYVKREFNLLIGEKTTENIKIKLGSVYEDEKETMKIIGIDLLTGIPKSITITEGEVKDALKDSVALILRIIKTTIKEIPPEILSDILDKGIMLTGGGALLKGLDKLIQRETHIPTHIAESPLDCVAIGTGKCLT